MSDSSAMGVTSFDTATRLRPRVDRSIFDVDVDPRWTVGDKPNGGYLLALLGRAGAEVVATQPTTTDEPGRPEVVSATVTYLAAAQLSPAEVHTTVLRRGRTASHLRAVLVQTQRALVDAVFVVGALAGSNAPRYSDVDPLVIPAPDDCVRLQPRTPDGVEVGILETTDLRLDPSTVPGRPQASGERAVRAELRGWLRFADGREPDPGSLLYFIDAIPPATMFIGSTGWAPTLSMSAYVRARPAPGWLGIRLTAHHVVAGTVDETCTLWDSTGRVVAQATQLARVRFPDERNS